MLSNIKIASLIFITFLCVLPNESFAYDRPIYRMNLDECVAMALKNNEQIKLTHYDVFASIAKKIEATKRYTPVVSYNYRIAPVPRDIENPKESFFKGDISVINSIRLDAGIPVSTFGRLTVAKELADIGIDASKLQKVRKADEVILDVYKLYHGILLARELKILANKGIDSIDKKIKELEKEETTDQLQILKLKAVVYQVEKKLDEATTKGTIALAMLKLRLGLEDDVDFDIKDKNLKREQFRHLNFNELLDQTKKYRPEFKLLAHNVLAKSKQIQLEKKAYLPNLYLGSFLEYGVSPGIRGDENENDFTNPFNFFRAGAGFELKGELDFRKIQSKVKVAEFEHLKAIADKRSNYRLLEIDLKNAYLEYQQKRRLLSRAEKEQKSARQVVFLTKSNLDIGLGEKKEYLEALQSYLLIQAAVFENVFNYNVSVAQIKSKIGTLYNAKTLNNY